ncbi:MAG TPA: DEAD/DEAH box helicase [Deltaproteobacteria bacterium]|nr:DEAD/DEAH box helicase [Deltaproteobacteria bacterium]
MPEDIVNEITHKDLLCIEFHRSAIALFPEAKEKSPGVAFLVKINPSLMDQQFCTCSKSRKKTCHHILRLTRVMRDLKDRLGGKDIDEHFRAGIFYKMASTLAQEAPLEPGEIQWKRTIQQDKPAILGMDKHGRAVVSYLAQDESSTRLLERLDFGEDHDPILPSRGAVLRQLALHTLSSSERILIDAGMKSRRMAIEESLWYRLFYHAYLESWDNDYSFSPAIDEQSGAFTVTCKDNSGNAVFRIEIPRKSVKRFITEIRSYLPEHHCMAISPIPLKSIFLANRNTEFDLEVRPAIELVQQNGEARYYEETELTKYRYGNLIYVRELGILAEIEDAKRKFTTPGKMVLKKAQIPGFLDENKDDLADGTIILNEEIKNIRIFKEYDRIEITPSALDRDWCWLSMSYGFGSTEISLSEIIQARQARQRYIATDEGWVDCKASCLDHLDCIANSSGIPEDPDKTGTVKLKKIDLFRLHSLSGSTPMHIRGQDDKAAHLEQMLELKPAGAFPNLEGMASPLRPYQIHGVQWIRFLHENGLGGLLCDDMGLGKTHQIMSFMVWLKQEQKGRFLVVCPTTVISHWEDKIRRHAPALNACIYHGTDRSMEAALDGNDVIITSYGVLRRDEDIFNKIDWGLAVFDEAQYIKNPQTLAYRCAVALKADMKIGVTGTPIENTIYELKALFDLVLPGYLGADAHFSVHYAQPIEQDHKAPAREELGRLISPFTLRRLKQSVLEELPPKIEDIRTCILSQDQVRLYREAIDSRSPGIMHDLEDYSAAVPYMHIFALLNLLKQICNHPALIDKDQTDYKNYVSGKWDLFTELLSESLESGQKVVVYSQYLGMIDIISNHLEQSGIGHVALTGKSRNRGKLIEKFNNDENCRVFIGSLKAGGTGIDLVSASVVIHYDRWWNAAKEDQATDRVHRIGQRRGVQVFKLVTLGTLEEKISALIGRKRTLAQSIISEDDPGLLKTFTREELIDILRAPAADIQ